MSKRSVFWSFLAVFIFLVACNGKEDQIILQKTAYTLLPGWKTQDKSAGLDAFKQSCKAFTKRPSGAQLRMGRLATSVNEWQKLCRKAKTINRADILAVHRFFEHEFEPYIVSNNGNKTGMFTGYYEPLLKGSKRKHGAYQYPLYRLPSDVVAGKPYYGRSEINQGALRNRGLEIVYVDNPVQAFFLHIQGSGRVLLDDGAVLKLGYAGKNNRKYVAIGRYLKEKGHILPEHMSAQAIKQWLYTHQDKASDVMELNPSYVFFRELDGGASGPIGGQGVPLTAKASLAVDKRFVPYGTPLWLSTTLPGGAEFTRLMVAQDTGGAIKGPVRGDIFFGFGGDAEYYAGRMKNPGSYIALWPRRNTL